MRKTRDKERHLFPGTMDPLPFIYLLPGLAGLAYAAIRWGGEIRNIVQVFIKLVVKA